MERASSQHWDCACIENPALNFNGVNAMAAKTKSVVIYLCMYLVFGFFFIRTSVPFDGELGYHASVLDKSKEQYVNRILFPFLIDYSSTAFNKLGISYLADIARLYKIAYIVVFAMAALMFQFYLMRWFEEKVAVIGTLILLMSLPFSFIITGHVDSIFDLLLFTAAAWLILNKRFLPLIPIVLIGSLNRQTVVFVSFLYFLANFEEKRWFKVSFQSGILFAIPVLTGFVVRYLRDVLDKQSYPNMFVWNVACHHCLISMLLLFHVFWILAFVGLRTKPFVLRRWALAVPFFLIIHYQFGFIWETRMFLPLAVILIPLGLLSLCPAPKHNHS